MLFCLYEHPRNYSSRGLQRSARGLCPGYSRCQDGAEDCCPSLDLGRSKAGLDSGRFGLDPNESESMGPSCKCEGFGKFEGQDPTRKTFSINSSDCPGGRGAFGSISSGIWIESSALGRSDSSGTLKAAIWLETESAASPELDASAGISFKTGQLYVSSSPGGRGGTVSPRVKKNFKIWGLGRQLSSRMRQDLPCIPGWDGDGRRWDTLFASLRPANMARDLIFRAGWHPFWGDMDLPARPEGIGKAS